MKYKGKWSLKPMLVMWKNSPEQNQKKKKKEEGSEEEREREGGKKRKLFKRLR